MSTLLGESGERWTLPQAVDAMIDAARQGGVPGLVWFVGALYPSLNLNADLFRGLLALVEESTNIELPGSGNLHPLWTLFAPKALVLESDGFLQGFGLLLVFMPLLFVVFRLVVGLARVSDPLLATETVESGESGISSKRGRRGRMRLRATWAAGKGLGATAFGMWLMLAGLLLGALLVVIGPLVALVQLLELSSFSPLFAGLLLPVLFLLLAYAAVLMVVYQLALHSLAHNRRGVASALTHAWRLVRASPWATLRSTVVDGVLFLTIEVLGNLLNSVLGPVGALLGFLLLGFAGVTRAGFWARTYRALGGLSSADDVPGL